MRATHALLILLSLFVPLMSATLVTYPAPSSSFPNGPYYVGVTQGSQQAQISSFVYYSAAPADGPATQQGRSMSWTTFSFNGTVTVTVSPWTKMIPSWSKVVLRPTSLGLTATHVKGAAVFTLTQPAKVVVEFDGYTNNSIMVFAHELEEQKPLRDGDIEFAAGVHDIGQGFNVPSGARVHLAGGAWVRGTLSSSSANGVVIEGRGVLSGDKLAHPSSATDALAMVNLCGNDIVVRGITVVNPPTYLVNLNPYWKGCYQTRSLVEDVKALGWHYTTDGIMVGRDSTVRDNFVRANDDSLKLYMSNTLWERNAIWQEDNGWPFMLSWNTMTDESNITVRKCSVVHVEHSGDFFGARAVFGSVHGGKGRLSGYRFEEIEVEGAVYRPFGITVQKSPFGKYDSGTIDDVTFRNVRFESWGITDSVIKGKVSRAAFHNLTIHGHTVASAADGHFDVSSKASDITFNIT